MAIKWSRLSPQVALMPAVVIIAVAFIGSILWTTYISFTRSRRFPEFTIDFECWDRQYTRLFRDKAWGISLDNLITLGFGSALAIVFGFVLAAMMEREKRGEDFFRTIFSPFSTMLIGLPPPRAVAAKQSAAPAVKRSPA